jgi:N-acyl-L-homoserine lactone synthetase
LKKYDEIAVETKNICSKTALVNGFFMAMFLGLSSILNVFSFGISTLFIMNGWKNWRTGEELTIEDVVITYQALAYGMFTLNGVLSIIPAVTRGLISGK